MTALPQKFYTPEEYLELERNAPYKSEYYGGRIYPMGDFEGNTPEAMAGGRSRHNAIRENLSIELGSILKRKGGCRTFSSDQRVYIPRKDLYTYPDLLAICGKPEYLDDESDTLTNPIVLVEVLSKSTAGYDRGEKFALYRRIPTLREYLILDSRRVGVELWRKNEFGFWLLALETDQPMDELYFQSLDVTLLVTDLYANTDDLPVVDF